MLHLGDGPAAHAVLRVDGADGSYHTGNEGVVSQSINAVFLFLNRCRHGLASKADDLQVAK
jgi:hypothetical protein